MSRRISLVLALFLVAAACADREPVFFESIAPDEPSTTTSITSTTTTTAAPIVEAPAPVSDLLGLGDSRYPGLGNGGYDVDHYDIDLTFDNEANTINAQVRIEATATLALQDFSLDFVGFDVTALTVDDQDAGFQRKNGELIIEAPSVIPSGEAFVVTVAYNGTPQPALSKALPFDVGWRTDPSGVSYVIGEPDGGSTWLPLNDHPSDKATYTFRITVPDPLVAAANGVLVDTITDLGWATWVWDSAQPMASYLATVVIGDLEIVPDEPSTAASGIAVRNVLPDDLSAGSLERLALHGEMMTFFAEIFGPYPFDAYGLTVVDDFEGALETQTLSIFGRYMVDIPDFFEVVMVHELAHQWFGNSVTPADWGDIWLNEGFATYAEWLWLEHRRGEQAMLATIQGARDQMAISDLPPPGNPPANDLFNASVYVRGGLVLHALRVEVGDEAFFAIIDQYADTYRNGNATTNDFIALAESVSGHDLGDLFDRWLFGPKVPPLP